MADKRKLEEVPPAKVGIKVKRKTPKPPPKEQEEARIITDAAPDRPASELPPASEEALHLESQALTANQNLIFYMKEFNKLLSRSILPENYSMKDKEHEQKVTADLTLAAQEVDRIEPGKGSLALSTFAVRQALLLRDAGNKLAYEIECLKSEIQKLKNPEEPQKSEVSDAEKKYILEKAKELGVKVSIED